MLSGVAVGRFCLYTMILIDKRCDRFVHGHMYPWRASQISGRFLSAILPVRCTRRNYSHGIFPPVASSDVEAMPFVQGAGDFGFLHIEFHRPILRLDLSMHFR